AEKEVEERLVAYCRRGSGWLGGSNLSRNVADPSRVDPDPRAHRAREGHRPQVLALRRRRLGPKDLVDHRQIVLGQASFVERSLSDHHAQVRLTVDAILELPGL